MSSLYGRRGRDDVDKMPSFIILISLFCRLRRRARVSSSRGDAHLPVAQATDMRHISCPLIWRFVTF